MAERASMAALIALTARLVNDTGHVVHSPEEVQAALDTYRIEARYQELTGLPTYVAGSPSYLTFTADSGYWETDGVLNDASYNDLTPTASDWMGGRWEMATEPSQPVMIVGFTHDPYQAAADLVDTRAAQLAEAYDFKTGPDSYSRSQMHKQLLVQATRLRAISPRLKALADAAVNWSMPEIGYEVIGVLCD